MTYNKSWTAVAKFFIQLTQIPNQPYNTSIKKLFNSFKYQCLPLATWVGSGSSEKGFETYGQEQ